MGIRQRLRNPQVAGRMSAICTDSLPSFSRRHPPKQKLKSHISNNSTEWCREGRSWWRGGHPEMGTKHHHHPLPVKAFFVSCAEIYSKTPTCHSSQRCREAGPPHRPHVRVLAGSLDGFARPPNIGVVNPPSVELRVGSDAGVAFCRSVGQPARLPRRPIETGTVRKKENRCQ